MKLKTYRWISVRVASLIIGFSLSIVNAQNGATEEPVKIEAPDAELEGEGHVHDENYDHDHPELKKTPTVEEIRAFLNKYAAYILPEFNKVIDDGDEEHMRWMMKDIAGVMDEHTALNKFDPKIAILFSEVLKLENDLHYAIESKLEAGMKAEDTGSAIKEQLKVLIVKRIELQKGQVAYKKYLLELEIKELEDATQKVDEITEKELKAIILELKQVQEEGS